MRLAINFVPANEDWKSAVAYVVEAERLGVAPASVTNMLQKLAASPASLVDYERHGGVQLSLAGKRRALEVVRHHRLIETFLYEVLDYPLEEVHDEAELDRDTEPLASLDEVLAAAGVASTRLPGFRR